MYNIGDKVEYLNNVWEVCDLEDDSVEIYNEKIGVNIYVPINDLTAYRTAHEKLIEMGYTHEQLSADLTDEFYGKNSFDYIWFSRTEKNYTLGNHLYVDVELSRILTQYLEELENE